jgi:DNA-binding MurR/RpiR family transcriptional regulator
VGKKLSLVAAQNDLEGKIIAALPQLSKKQKEIARFILDNKGFVTFASVHDVATRTNTSAATVVRFCQALGYQGYVQLRATLRDRLTEGLHEVESAGERLSGPLLEEDLLARVFATDIRNIERTAVLADSERLQAAATDIRHARQVLVVGSGLTAAMVESLAYALQVMNLPARSITGGGEPLALALAFLQAKDVLVGIGFHPDLKDLVEALEQARTVGAKSIGITDSELSPLARLSDHPFLVATHGVAHHLSLAAAMSLLNALVATLSFDMPDRIVESLSQVDAAYKRGDLLAE